MDGIVSQEKPHVCDKDLPCTQHITILLWVLGILVTAVTMLVVSTVDNRNKAIAEIKEITEKTAIADAEINAGRARARLEIDSNVARLREDTNKLYYDIVQRLTRIESKVEKLK